MTRNPESERPEDSKAVLKAVEDLLASFLPDEVHGAASSALPAQLPNGLDPLQMRALRQAGIEPAQIEARIIKVEVDQIRRDIERLERTVEAQDEKSMTAGQVYVIAFGVLAALVAMVALLHGSI